jgi:[ribosomal protein S5]-alanine N-acetyltransferase
MIEDAVDFYNLNQDIEVIKYTGDKPFESVVDAGNFLSTYDQYV